MASRRTPAADPTPQPSGWHEFVGPYPIVLMDRGIEVAPGERLEFPAGPPDTVNWRPVAAPADEES